MPTSSCFSRIRVIASGCGVGAARCDERLDDLPHLGADAGEVGERLGRALRAAAARQQEGEALVHQAVEPWVLLHRQADQAERDRGRKRRRDRARDLDDAVGLGAVDDVADDLADHLLAAAHRARVEERRDDGADEGVPRLILLADLARRRLPSLEDVERDAREAPGGSGGRGRRRRGASERTSGSVRPRTRAPRRGASDRAGTGRRPSPSSRMRRDRSRVHPARGDYSLRF